MRLNTIKIYIVVINGACSQLKRYVAIVPSICQANTILKFANIDPSLTFSSCETIRNISFFCHQLVAHAHTFSYCCAPLVMPNKQNPTPSSPSQNLRSKQGVGGAQVRETPSQRAARKASEAKEADSRAARAAAKAAKHREDANRVVEEAKEAETRRAARAAAKANKHRGDAERVVVEVGAEGSARKQVVGAKNYSEKWRKRATEITPIEGEDPGRKQTKTAGKYTGKAKGQCKWGGWNSEGISQFNYLRKLVKTDREADKSNEAEPKQMEKFLLDYCRTKAGKKDPQDDENLDGAGDTAQNNAAARAEAMETVEAEWDSDED